MNSGLICGQLFDAATGDPLTDGVVSIDWILGGTNYLPFYPPEGDDFMDRVRALGRGVRSFDAERAIVEPTRYHTIATQPDSMGCFALFFQWSGTDLGAAMEQECRFQLNVQRHVVGGGLESYPNRARAHGTLRRVVSLRQIANGLIPDPREASDLLGMGINMTAVLRRARQFVPQSLMIVGPSPDYFALFGAVGVNVR